MKPSLIIAIFILTAFTACKRDYTCICKEEIVRPDTVITNYTAFPIYNVTKREAKDQCKNGQTWIKFGGQTTTTNFYCTVSN